MREAAVLKTGAMHVGISPRMMASAMPPARETPVVTPMHKDDPKDFLRTLQPMGQIAGVNDVIDAVVYLAHAGQVTGEVLHVDGGSHAGRW